MYTLSGSKSLLNQGNALLLFQFNFNFYCNLTNYKAIYILESNMMLSLMIKERYTLWYH